jgi:hypothetical protein
MAGTTIQLSAEDRRQMQIDALRAADRKAAEQVRTVRFILSCKRCKTAFRADYTPMTSQGQWGRTFITGYSRPAREGELADRSGLRFLNDTYAVINRETVYLPGDCTCPTCGHSRKAAQVIGHYSPDHMCDSRCVNATGPNCDCQCGGANHGAAWG